MIRILDQSDGREIVRRTRDRLLEAERVVAPILAEVRAGGDRALLEHARRLDGFEGERLAIDPGICSEAWNGLDASFKDAVAQVSTNIRAFAALQMPREGFLDLPGGGRVGQVVRPLSAVGAYIPGGRYPLPSTLLMTAIPAQVAGVQDIAICCPRPSPEVLGVASWLGVTRVLQVGGAHAVAALAYGTESIARVDRIVGPGNAFVAAAKRLLAGETGIDFVAGPTETVIIASEGRPGWIAADMLAQSEHDVDASAILLTPSRPFAEAVALEIEKQICDLPTAKIARASLDGNGAILLVGSLDEAVAFANDLAPEHLSLPDASLLGGVTTAGSVFIGAHSPEAAGDYGSGPNHVLPTGGAARQRGGLSTADFVKVISVHELTEGTLSELSQALSALARAEGLEAHARSVEVRRRG